MSAAKRRLAVPAEKTTDAPADVALLRRLLPFMIPYRGLFLGAMALMPLSALAGLAQPWLIKSGVDAIVMDQSTAGLQRVVWLFAIAIAVDFVLRFSQTYMIQLAGQRSTADLRRSVFDHLQRIAVRYFDRTPVGRIVTRVTNDIDSLAELFVSGAVTALTDLLTLAGIVVAMLLIDWQLSLIAFAALIPLAISLRIFRKAARKAFGEIRLRIAELNAYLAEQVAGVAVVQAYGREQDCADEYDGINDAYRTANFSAIRYDALLYSIVQSVSVACVAVVLYFAAVRAGWLAEGVGSAAYVGTVVAFYEYIQRFFVPVRDLATKFTIIQSSLASAERVFSLLDVEEFDAPESADHNAEGVNLDTAPAIEFQHVTFAYRQGQPVLHDLSLSIAADERVAVVGATGSGKSTLLALLLRLYELEPNSGRILVKGQDIRSMERHALRRGFSIVPQDVFLFAGTLRDNLALTADGEAGTETEKDQRLWDALERAGAADLVRGRGGLDARVDPRATNFSAGERQLLAFARALYRDTDLLLLDEATANIDSETEAKLQTASEELLASRTSLVIAHRLSTIEKADRIIVMDQGEIKEQGSHLELLAVNGLYARLHRLQAADAQSTL